MEIEAIMKRQRAFWQKGKTLDIAFRKAVLIRIYQMIKKNEKAILEALKTDLGKSYSEGYMCEVGLVYSEIKHMLKHIDKYAKKQRVMPSIAQVFSSCYQIKVPHGVVLIMSPWNYPFLLSIEPLVDAIAAGNCVILKPSAYAPTTSHLIKEMLEDYFPKKYISVVEGGREVNQNLLDQDFDMVFFTGSQAVGKVVLEKCAKHLTPAVLELGGKSPCIVDDSANINLAARRIVFGKLLNAGQTCVAPDYILCDKKVKTKLIQAITREIKRQYGDDCLNNENYGHIVNEKHFRRLLNLMSPDKIVYGGKANIKGLKIEPTIMDEVTWDDKVMKEEIFGPILPILTYDNFDDMLKMINNKPKPLALYLFTNNKQHCKDVDIKCCFGGGCINDTIIHLATSNMGFGGVKESGMGSYHGLAGYNAFSHQKNMVESKQFKDIRIRYQPYNKIIDRIIHIIW